MSQDSTTNPFSQPAPAAPRRPRFDYGVPASAPASAALNVPLSDGAAVNVKMLVAGSALFAVAFLALYWGSLLPLIDLWSRSTAWGHGFIVPAISAYLIFIKWSDLKKLQLRGSAIGLAILLTGVVGQILFRATGTTHMSHLSMLVVLLGAGLWVLGWNHMRMLWLPVAYLVFAINPPDTLYQKATQPMQAMAAWLGTKILPLLNISARQEETIIRVFWNGKDTVLNVEEACSGMKMLVAFAAVAVALAYTTDRPMWQRLFLSVCAIPVAIVCNALRVAVIGYLVVAYDEKWAHGDAHGWAGMAMLAPAMLMQMGLAWLLDKIFVEEPAPRAAASSAGSAAGKESP